jgi:hypothetical protein
MHHAHSRSGVALVTATIVLVVLLALSVTISEVTVSSLRQSQARVNDVALTTSVESAANLAFNHLQNRSDLPEELIRAKSRAASDPAADLTATVEGIARLTVNGQERSTLNGAGVRTTWKWLGLVEVPILGNTEKQDMYQITATAAFGGPARYYDESGKTPERVEDLERYRRRRVEVLFTKFPNTIFKQAMFAKKGYEFMGSATTDSWDSKYGAVAYSVAAKGANGDLSSEGNIIVQKEEAVQGDVNPYVKLPIPRLTYNPPPGAKDLGAFSATPAGSPLTAGSYVCTSLTQDPAGKSAGIEVAAGAAIDIYLDGPLTIKADWIIPATTTVRIFQNDYDSKLGQTTLNGNITIGCPQNPRSLQIYSLYDGQEPDTADVTPWDIKMNGSAQLSAVLFCPHASFKLNGTFDMYGSLIADSFRETTDMGKVNGNFKFHYDESLGNLEFPFPPSLVVVGWNSYDLGLAEFRNPAEPDPAKRIRWDDP